MISRGKILTLSRQPNKKTENLNLGKVDKALQYIAISYHSIVKKKKQSKTKLDGDKAIQSKSSEYENQRTRALVS